MDPLNRSMLPSMPSISTPFKSQCLDDMEDLLPIQPCISTNLEMQSVTADSMRCTITTHNLNFKDVFSSIQGSTVKSSSHVTINLPPVSISDRLTPPKLPDSCQKSQFQVISPLLKKCNSQLSGKSIHKSPTAKPIARAHLPTPHTANTVQSLPLSSTTNSTAGCSKSSELNVPVTVNENGCDNEDELAALMTASSTIPRCPKRKPPHLVSKAKSLKEVREAQIMLSMLDPDTDVIKLESSNNFAQEFFNAMKDCLEENDDSELFQKVLTVMSEYDVNNTPVTEFYDTIIKLLINYPNLSEQFVAFLLPDQALECGKFMDHLKIVNMRNFVKQLKIFFAKQPQQLRFVFAALEKLVQRKALTVVDIKASVLPLLKGNSLLVNNFLMLLPQERPPESMMTEFEEMEIDSDHSGNEDELLTVSDQVDPYGSDICVCLCHNSLEEKLRSRFSHCVSCGTKFIHGKVYQQIGRALRPAKVAFPGYPNQTKRLYIKVFPKIRGRKRAETVSKGIQVSPKSDMSSVEVGGDSKNTSPKSSRTTKPKVTATNRSRASISKCTQTVNTNKTAAHVRTTASKVGISTTASSTTCELTSRHCLSPPSFDLPVDSTTVTFPSAPVPTATVLLSDYSSTSVNVDKGINDLVSLAKGSQEYVKIDTDVIENCNNNSKKTDLCIDFQSVNIPFSNECIPIETRAHFECYPENRNTMDCFDIKTTNAHLDMSNECVPSETNFINDYMEKCDTAILLQSNNGSTEFFNRISSTIDSNSSEICHEEAYLSHNLEYNPPDEYISMDTYFEENCVLTKDILTNHNVEEEGMNCSSTTDTCGPHLAAGRSTAARLSLENQGDSSPVVTTSTVETSSVCTEEALQLATSVTSSVVLKMEPFVELSAPVASTSDDVGSSRRSDSSACLKNATGNKTSRPWTKDEDKVILLEVRRGYCLDKTLQNIQGLPQRTLKEICERFHMLMKMLEEMTVPKEENSSSSSSSTI